MSIPGIHVFNIGKDQYLVWQQRLKDRKWYRYLVVFSGIYSILLFVPLGVYLLLSENGWRIVVYCLASFILARGIITESIAYLYKKQRPYQVYSFDPFTSWLFSSKSLRENSFPSGHTVSVVSISTALFPFLPRFALAGMILALVVGYGRVRLGNHFPVDILGGFILGIASGLLIIRFIIPA